MGRQGSGGSGVGTVAETNVHMGDLSQIVTEIQLVQAFRARYASNRHAKVVCNGFGVPNRFGFLRFGDVADDTRAVAEMQRHEFNRKPTRLVRRLNSYLNSTPASGVDASGYNKRPKLELGGIWNMAVLVPLN